MEKVIIITTKNSIQTRKVGKNLAQEMLKSGGGKTAPVLTLSGDLGAGKTTFLQGFAAGLGIKEKILSPTFVLMKRFKISDARFKNFYHIDCYRLNNSEEILYLGLKKIVANPENIVAIEWPEKIKKTLPKNAILIKFTHLKENKRKILINK